jgi:glutaredoxin
MNFTYLNVTRDQTTMDRMLQYTKGRREVPVIVENERVSIGYGGS